MQYYSLGKISPNVNFKTAAITGQAPDKGLYFPTEIPKFTITQIERFKTLDKATLAFEVMKPYVNGLIDDASLLQICAETINFDFPLVPITDTISSLELFHGPTLAFKDVGARFMSRCLGYFSKELQVGKVQQRSEDTQIRHIENELQQPQKSTVLVATSGDTGGAVANGFLGVDGVDVIILYPKGKVSPIQELQLTTCGQNITALEVDGSFDDCQAIVKDAFMDTDLNAAYNLTSANSINVARWLPQQLYYFFAWQQWVAKYGDNVPMHIVVPSGNFGNICAGMIAKASGLPLGHFVAACNNNNVVTRFLETGNYEVHKAVATVSNAMDVGNPSNFVRIMEIMQNNFDTLKKGLSSYSYDDITTQATITRVYNEHKYTLDPHGAVAFLAAEAFIEDHEYLITHFDHTTETTPVRAIILETAHPVKFPDVVEEAIGQTIAIPDSVKFLLDKEKVAIPMVASFGVFKSWMLSKVSA
jgi:threonine synthase